MQAHRDMVHELLSRGETVSFTAHGASMWPFILDGDSVSLSPITNTLSLGDVVFVPNVEFGQLHRVVAGLLNGRYRLRGDALLHDDGWISSARIGGRLVSRQRNGVNRTVFGGRSSVVVARVLSRARHLVSTFRTTFLGK